MIKMQAMTDVAKHTPAMILPPFLRLKQTQQLSGNPHDVIYKNLSKEYFVVKSISLRSVSPQTCFFTSSDDF